MLPARLRYVDSWIDAQSLTRCFQLMETDDPELFDMSVAQWSDLGEFEIVAGPLNARSPRETSA